MQLVSKGRLEFVNHMEKDFGQIDVLVNNAALGYDEPDKVPEKALAESYLKCNFLATMAFTELLLPLLSSDGKVINVSSRVGALSNHSGVVHSDM